MTSWQWFEAFVGGYTALAHCHDHLTPDQETATPVASQPYSSTLVTCKHSWSWTHTLGVTLGLNSFLTYCLYYTSPSTLP